MADLDGLHGVFRVFPAGLVALQREKIPTQGLSWAPTSIHFSIYEQLLRRNVTRYRGGLVTKATRLVYHSTPE